MAVPFRSTYRFVIQDNRGFKAQVVLVGNGADISADLTPTNTHQANVAAIGTALAAMTNAKVVSTGWGYEFDIAQEPSSETGTYQLVTEKAHCTFGDGNTLKEFASIPAPKDALFLTGGSDNLIVVNPAASILTAFQTATQAEIGTASGGFWGAQFFGGQLRAVKPRRRRVLQGA